ncbi:hypothetical protein [Arthrobacter sp. A2-55]|uniref:hypothetical protein n=1 Tax=Arthrobacter sp. A2-55 TaxID=2897337 RepID=UPI0021CD8077|nr:hypothetical protein [Arthrobacter sp. A2-55]MCU6480522.1 hypothetical protein [Arthrobacter sp. A2-55]
MTVSEGLFPFTPCWFNILLLVIGCALIALERILWAAGGSRERAIVRPGGSLFMAGFMVAGSAVMTFGLAGILAIRHVIGP